MIRKMLSRSRPWATERTGGQSYSFGATVHSFASTMGTRAKPTMTCRPWVKRYSQTGDVGHWKK